MGKVKLNSANRINEGILGDDDYTPVVPNRGFSDRSIGDEFFRTGRNSMSNIIENPDMEYSDELTDDDFEDMGYDYDGSDVEIDDGDDDDAGYAYHPDLRSQLNKFDQRLTSIESMLVDITDLFGSRGTSMFPRQ